MLTGSVTHGWVEVHAIWRSPVRSSGDFVEAVVASPLGVSWLAVLEAGLHEGRGWPSTSPRSDPASVAAAVARVGEVSFGRLMQAAVYAAVMECGPWIGDAPAKIADAYRAADQRVPIAVAIADRFGAELHMPLGRTNQQWWTDAAPWIKRLAPLFGDFEHVYGAGEFTWAGLRTATDPPPEAMLEMVGAWEIETGPLSRWWMPVADHARVFEVHRPADWARLVAEHPRDAEPHPGWELPGINQHRHHVAPLRDVPGQRAMRLSVGRHLVPNWAAVADHYDGVHLSWAGFITTEGCIVDLGHGDVTMLRYWFSERTLWLADVFADPTPAPDPHIDLSGGHPPPFPRRIAIDRQILHRLLGR